MSTENSLPQFTSPPKNDDLTSAESVTNLPRLRAVASSGAPDTPIVTTREAPSASAAICIAAEVLLLARFAAGTRVTETEITADLVASGAGVRTLPFPAHDGGSLSGLASLGTRAGFFQSVFSSFTYASGAQAGAGADGGAAIAADASSILDGSFDNDAYRQLYMSGAFAMSLAEGDLATWTDATFSYESMAGAPAVVYGDGGLVIS